MLITTFACLLTLPGSRLDFFFHLLHNIYLMINFDSIPITFCPRRERWAGFKSSKGWMDPASSVILNMHLFYSSGVGKVNALQVTRYLFKLAHSAFHCVLVGYLFSEPSNPTQLLLSSSSCIDPATMQVL